METQKVNYWVIPGTKMKANNVAALADITSSCLNYYGVSLEDLKGRSRKARYSEPRQIMMYLMVKYTKMTKSAIGRYFNRHHGTVINAVRSVENAQEYDKNARAKIRLIEAGVDYQRGNVLHHLMRAVANQYGISTVDIATNFQARRASIYLMRTMLGMTYAAIGNYFSIKLQTAHYDHDVFIRQIFEQSETEKRVKKISESVQQYIAGISENSGASIGAIPTASGEQRLSLSSSAA
jgi:chromosomal replication initiation ATPase DnaA